MVSVVSGSLYRRTHSLSRLGRRPLGAILHSSNQPSELSQWLCHDDSTINIVLVIIIIIIIIIIIKSQVPHSRYTVLWLNVKSLEKAKFDTL